MNRKRTKQYKRYPTIDTCIHSSHDVKNFECIKWNRYFTEALAGDGQEHERNLWWRISDADSIELVKNLFPDSPPESILEAGCGSGGTTFLVAEILGIPKVHLLDISFEALRFAKSIEPPTLVQPTKYCQGDVFALPYSDDSFELVWNVGLIEHYPPKGVIEILREMQRVTRPGGYVLAAIPNRRCLAVMKAAVLGSSFGETYLGWIKGYRFDTEILYGNREMALLIRQGLDCEVQIRMAGNCLWSSAADILVRASQTLGKKMQTSFLTFFVLPVK
jgi:SAM-dependent methyltransferase